MGGGASPPGGGDFAWRVEPHRGRLTRWCMGGGTSPPGGGDFVWRVEPHHQGEEEGGASLVDLPGGVWGVEPRHALGR